MDTDRIVEIYRAANLIEAHALRNALESSGIEARVIGDVLSTASGIPPGVETAPRIWVHDTDEHSAREIIAAWQAKRDARDTARPEPAWKCGRCGVDVDGEFELCWQCGAAREKP